MATMRRIIVPLGLVAVLSMSVAAAQDPPGGPPGRPPDDVAIGPGQVQQLFDAMIVMQAQQQLSLSDAQYAQFLPRLRVLQETRRRILRDRNRLIMELQRLTNPRSGRQNATDGAIKERLAALGELDSRGAAEIRKAYHGIDEVLDVWQQGRFRVFEEQIERRKLELIGRARQANPNRPQQPRRPPPSW